MKLLTLTSYLSITFLLSLVCAESEVFTITLDAPDTPVAGYNVYIDDEHRFMLAKGAKSVTAKILDNGTLLMEDGKLMGVGKNYLSNEALSFSWIQALPWTIVDGKLKLYGEDFRSVFSGDDGLYSLGSFRAGKGRSDVFNVSLTAVDSKGQLIQAYPAAAAESSSVVPIAPSSSAPVESSSAAPVESSSSAPVESSSAAPVESSSAAPVESSSAAPVEASSAAPVESSSAAPVEASSAAPVESSSSAPVESSSAAPVEASSAAPVESSSSAPVESSSAAPVESSSAAPVESSSAAPVESSSAAPVEASSSAPVESSSAASAEPSPVISTKASSVSNNSVVTVTTSQQSTTLVTITSCSEDKCSLYESPALISTATVTIGSTITEYTTWCDLTVTHHAGTSASDTPKSSQAGSSPGVSKTTRAADIPKSSQANNTPEISKTTRAPGSIKVSSVSTATSQIVTKPTPTGSVTIQTFTNGAIRDYANFGLVAGAVYMLI